MKFPENGQVSLSINVLSVKLFVQANVAYVEKFEARTCK